MSKFTAAELVDFYQKVADGREIQYGVPKSEVWVERNRLCYPI